MPEAFVTVLSAGMDISAHSLVFPDRVFEGVVTSVDTRLDPVSRAVQVRASIPNEDGLLKPGMFMSVNLERDLGEVVLAPEQAIVPEGSRQYVFVVVDGVAEQRPVQIGRRIPGYAVIQAASKPAMRWSPRARTGFVTGLRSRCPPLQRPRRARRTAARPGHAAV